MYNYHHYIIFTPVTLSLKNSLHSRYRCWTTKIFEGDSEPLTIKYPYTFFTNLLMPFLDNHQSQTIYMYNANEAGRRMELNLI